MLLHQSLSAYFSTHCRTCIACVCCSVLRFTSAATFRPPQVWMLLKNIPDCCLRQIQLQLQLWIDFHGSQWKTSLIYCVFDQWCMGNLDCYSYLCCQAVYTTCKLHYLTLHWVLCTVSIKHKLHTCRWTWLLNMNNTQHLFLCRNHCHNMCTPGRLETKGFNFWWGLKKFSDYQLIHQNLVSHTSFIVLWTAESVSFFFNCPVHDIMYQICFFKIHSFYIHQIHIRFNILTGYRICHNIEIQNIRAISKHIS